MTWKRKPCKTCGGETRRVRGSRYCEEHTLLNRPDWMRRAYQRDPEIHKRRSRRAYLKRMYGLNEEEYEQLLLGGCNICGSIDNLHVDHDHGKPGTYRGILCRNCNAAIGLFKDNPALLIIAAEYLKGVQT